MTEDQKKILQLEEELEKLSSQINFYRQEVNQLKEKHIVTPVKESKEEKPGDKKEDPVATSWEFPSYKTTSPAGLENFIGLKLLHLTGIVVLVIGISIGVKYAVDKEMISPTARIAMAYLAGAILYFLSVRLRKKFELFSAILFSGAMASLYFTTYAGFVYYQLFPSGVAFALMVFITIFTAYTAIRYNKEEIGILGMIGAYGIPFLISSNSDRADLFFAYITLINCGIVFLSYKKTWKGMVRLAMLVSWALFLGWALTKYNDALQLQAVVVMIIFYVLFTVVSVGFAISKKEPLGSTEVQLFLLNNILAFAGALLVFTDSRLDVRSIPVTGIACIVFSIQALLAKLFLPQEKLVFNYLTAFAVLSLVCYVGMKWDGLRVTMTWLALAIGLFAAGAAGKMGWLRLMSIILTGVTLGKLVLIDRNNFTTGQKIISYISIGILLLLLSFFYQKFRQKLFAGKEKS
ncbi:MAG: DUF2339 domain-containing protein [Ferruginibacter sp.]|nr:DUF2339 domain-containing protein [Chitinophagaceae bacterium]